MQFEQQDLVALAEAAGHDFNADGPLVLAFRNEDNPGTWNDWIIGLKKDTQMAVVATVDPGKTVMDREGTGRFTTNVNGAARIKYGFYPNFFYMGVHGGKADHPCLRQAYAVPVQRYQDDTGEWKDFPPTVGSFNLHRASFHGNSSRVGNWSHGCLVVQNRLDHWRLLTWLGHPEHSPTKQQVESMRWSLLLTRLQH